MDPRRSETGVARGTARRVVAQIGAVAVVLGWGAAASAHPGYPGVVDTALGVKGITSKIAPQMGCQLCHVTPAGGTTQLGPFGTLLVTKYGLVLSNVEEDPSLVAALARLKMGDPKLFMDMAKGIDPNSDQTVVSEAPPHPEYGCSASPPPATSGRLAPLFGLFAVVFWRWRRWRQRSP